MMHQLIQMYCEIKLSENDRWCLVFFFEFDQLISLDATKR